MNGTQIGSMTAKSLLEKPQVDLDGDDLLVLLREYIAAVARGEGPEPLPPQAIDLVADELAQTRADVRYLLSEVECWREVALQGTKLPTQNANTFTSNGEDHT